MRLRLLLLHLGSTVCALPAHEPSHGQKVKGVYQDYGSEKVRGGKIDASVLAIILVNIGGWGVLEPWITPSIFESLDQSLGIVDEFTLCQKLPGQAASILNAHWSTFYTFVSCFEIAGNMPRLADFQAIAATGINTVRIPVGLAHQLTFS